MRRFLVGLGAVLLGLAGGAATAEPAGRPPDLLLVTLDTFRGDHLGANGASPVPTPALDRLARAGANFTRARSPAPLTLPAHASLLTGLSPHVHGVRDNGAYRLGEGSVTLAEVLAGRGYDRAAFVASFVLDRRHGLDQGFELYDDRVARSVERLETVEAERDGEAVLGLFERWLAGRDPARPLFAWVHLYDPHAPYEPPERYRERYRDRPYLGEIAWVDEIVGRLAAAVEPRRRDGPVLLAVVGDHGEGLGEHGETTHGLLIYNSTLHVPMILHAPGLVPAVEVPDLVRSVDLAPTLLDYLGVTAEFGEGESLRPLVERRRAGAPPPEDEAREAVSESLYARLHLGWSALYGLETERYRFILAPRPELYDLGADPGETTNRVEDLPAVARWLRAKLGDALAAPSPAPETALPVDTETAAKLRALGYFTGSRARGPERRSAGGGAAIDPKEKIDLWEELQLGMALAARGDDRGAVRRLAQVLESEPDLPLLYEVLGASHLRLEEFEHAERVYRQALERGIETVALRIDLGIILVRRGESAAAERELRRALELDPASVAAHHRLGDLHRGAGRREDAIASYRRALDLNPDYVYAWNGLGISLAAGGRDAEALEAFRRAVDFAPLDPRGLLNLALQLEAMGKRAEALEVFERCAREARKEPRFAGEARRAAEALERLHGGRG